MAREAGVVRADQPMTIASLVRAVAANTAKLQQDVNSLHGQIENAESIVPARAARALELIRLVYQSDLKGNLKAAAAFMALQASSDPVLHLQAFNEFVAWNLGKSPRQARIDCRELERIGVLVPVDYMSGGAGRAVRWRFEPSALPPRPMIRIEMQPRLVRSS